YQSVTSALWSSAEIGASRWLDANRLAGTSTISAMARAAIALGRFIEFSSRDFSLVDVAIAILPLPHGAAPQRLRLESVYELKYGAALESDLWGRQLFTSHSSFKDLLGCSNPIVRVDRI